LFIRVFFGTILPVDLGLLKLLSRD